MGELMIHGKSATSSANLASNILMGNGKTVETEVGALTESLNRFQWYIDNGWLPEIPEGDVPKNLEDCSWTMIKKLVASDTFKNYYKIGDTKTITLSTNEKVVMQVASINNGYGDAGTFYPKGTVDFISVDCLKTDYKMNTTDTNVGGWNSCKLRNDLNTTILSQLPNDLQNYIIEKTHYRSNGSQTTTLVSSSDKLWLPTEYEIFGENTRSANTENASYNNKYPIFTDVGSRIKHLGTNGSVCGWWESSPYVGNAASFCLVSSVGATSYHLASYSGDGLPICFRIG